MLTRIGLKLLCSATVMSKKKKNTYTHFQSCENGLFTSGKEELFEMTGHVMCNDSAVVQGVGGDKVSPNWKCK